MMRLDKDCECPICAMRKVLETNAVEYTMGPSYMEDGCSNEYRQDGILQRTYEYALIAEK